MANIPCIQITQFSIPGIIIISTMFAGWVAAYHSKYITLTDDPQIYLQCSLGDMARGISRITRDSNVAGWPAGSILEHITIPNDKLSFWPIANQTMLNYSLRDFIDYKKNVYTSHTSSNSKFINVHLSTFSQFCIILS